ncbi:TetR/AcrR family transcriptional regulator [Psychromicrobium lacuslunae]|uniref:HTH tetR-type domain-containing protein n=1 Tax=Psychromicrobium lacuslunae TaxID=1618207 RepID=A0A0D4C432_9MICC|nr:TetR/AcrR family transcriptional regulator [Psychromicrobium lacuslunae]AJT43135.1 hypothetical protein UM93_13230 [Psychromicrobium lacuslunae]
MHSNTPAVRQNILAAARRVISRDGAEALTISSVAEEAGLSVGGLRYHFRSKHELLAALVDAMVASFDQALNSAGVEPGAKTRAYISATLDVESSAQGSTASTGLLAAVALDSSLLEVLRKHFQRWQEMLDHDGIDPSITTVVRLAIDGWWLAAFLGLAAPDARRTSAAREVLESMLGGATDD